jgi:hypothetical protein
VRRWCSRTFERHEGPKLPFADAMVPIADTFDDRAVHVMMEAVDGRFWDNATLCSARRTWCVSSLLAPRLTVAPCSGPYEIEGEAEIGGSRPADRQLSGSKREWRTRRAIDASDPLRPQCLCSTAMWQRDRSAICRRCALQQLALAPTGLANVGFYPKSLLVLVSMEGPDDRKRGSAPTSLARADAGMIAVHARVS